MANAKEQPFWRRVWPVVRPRLWPVTWRVLLVIALAGLFTYVWWKVPPALYRNSGGGEDARLKAITETRTALLAGLIGVGALLTFWLNSRVYRITAQTLRVTEQGQITDRYTKAIEQLGSDKLDVRLGGIYALERIAKDSAQDGPMIAEVLTGFIRGRASWPPIRPDQPAEDTAIKDIPFLRYRAPDVQAALTVLGRQSSMTASQALNLSDSDLRRADLSDADLQRARLLGARLQGANVRGAQLQYVNLRHAQLHGARSNAATLWPEGFNWEAAGVELIED
jgi:hypothetical protein